MAGLRTSVQLEAIETLDSHGMPGELLVQELTLDLDKESAYNFAKKLNKRVQVVLQYADDHGAMEDVLDGSDDEVVEKKPETKPPKGKSKQPEPKPTKEDPVVKEQEAVVKEPEAVAKEEAVVAKEEKSVDDLLNEIV